MQRPEARNQMIERDRQRIRRKHKMSNRKKRRVKFAPGEENHLKTVAVILKIAGFSHTQIGAAIGITRGQIGDWMQDEEVKRIYFDALEAIPSAAKELLQTYSIEAVQAIATVMRHSRDDKMILEAARDILDRSGLPKAQRSEIDRKDTKKIEFDSGDAVQSLRELPVEMQEQAAQMIEELESNLQQLVSESKPPDKEES